VEIVMRTQVAPSALVPKISAAVLVFAAAVLAGAWIGSPSSATASSSSAAAASLDPRTAADGLKEALGVGTGRSVDLLGRPDGYLKNLDVRIPMPEKLHVVDRGLRTVGRSDLVEEFVTSMNRAAEAAAPLARSVFLDTIKQMTFQDAMTIVRGRDHEATDYLRANAGPRLDALFRPIVAQQLDHVGATRSFDSMMGRASTLPVVGRSAFDLDAYVTGKALGGLFLMIGREEERIRKDPVARTTDLLKTVFGAAGESTRKKTPWWQKVAPTSHTP
jgi:uncharacterized protein DUF4197